MSPGSLPVIDLGLLSSPEGRETLHQQVYDALTGPGFLYLQGVPAYDPDELHECTQWFFKLPLEERMRISKKMFVPSSSYTYRGFFPVQLGKQSHKEAFEVGSFMEGPGSSPYEWAKFFFEDNQWPRDPPDSKPFARIFRERMEKYYQVFTDAGMTLLQLVAGAWGAEKDTLTKLFGSTHLSTFRLIRYPSRGSDLPECALKDDIVLQCDEHQDSGFVTMLETFGYPGLQLQTAEGTWQDVEYRKGSLIVNIGLLLSKISGGLIKATHHRVVDCGAERFSVPFFLEPRFDANVNVTLTPPACLTKTKDTVVLLPSGKPLPYGSWLLKNLVGFIEYKSLEKYLKDAENV
ncbi:2-oxoglutarate-dependent dioxygenase tropC-like isoform X2 [Hyalella azteca]|uniref:2-oxoglutarate-dependent dioxygenase tropC-like isoform X2 n=1 Tax=Hyalella azteca TaxID=294128 RepID=A0A979FM59_HYAAZ|nr:2-oxoglutarate-dependent dioxygenase tropC-like isoform X2 [Hyalella azteca]